MKTINEITLYDLMAEDLEVWVTKSRKFGLKLEIEDENGDILIQDNEIHPEAARSFANFCRQFVMAYDLANLMDAA